MKRSLLLLSLLATPCILISCGDDNDSVATSTQMTPSSPSVVYRLFEKQCETIHEKKALKAGYAGKAAELKKVRQQLLNKYCMGAALGGHSELVFKAINRAKDDVYKKIYASYALHGAAAGGHTELVETLVKKGALISSGLEGAAEGKQMSVIQTLRGKEKNAPDFILEGAAHGGHMDLVKMMLEEGADPSDGFEGAAEGGHLKIAKLLLSKGAHISDSIKLAARGGHIEMVKLILDNSKSFELDVQDGLIYAARGGHMNIVKLLLDKGGNPINALQGAAYGGHVKIVQEMLKKGVAPNEGLSDAVRGGNKKVVQLLIEKGADPNKCDALLIATIEGHADIVQYLLTLPDVHKYPRDVKGRTLLDIAEEEGYKDCAELIRAAM